MKRSRHARTGRMRKRSTSKKDEPSDIAAIGSPQESVKENTMTFLDRKVAPSSCRADEAAPTRKTSQGNEGNTVVNEDTPGFRDSADNGISGQNTKEDPPYSKHASTQTVIEKGLVEFSLGPIDSELVCSVCKGYYRDPHTTTTCFHTFCKSCIFQRRNVESDGIYCPECRTFLGTLGKESSKVALFDRTLQEIIDKVVFPNLYKEDEENERAFYEGLDIALKPEYAKEKSPEQEPRRPTRRRIGKDKYMIDEVNFILKPADPYEMPPLDRPCLQTQSCITVGQLKKYLMQKMPETVSVPSMVDIHCNGVRLGEELSVFFILRTVWLETENDLKLTYQLAK